ncbi:MAG: hypothetical protein IPN93_02945 [Bacteroidetes bacterium]|nr:hypothetical protein [Bacteroidota bacterium]
MNYFKSKGYTNAELYATTWGDANMSNAAQNTIPRPIYCMSENLLKLF